MLRTIMIGTISAQGYVTRFLPDGYARVVLGGRTFTGKLVQAMAVTA